MAERVSEEIDGVDVFTYDTDLLAAAHELRKPVLLEIAKGRNYTGLYKLNKAELAIIVANVWTCYRDEERALADDLVNEKALADAAGLDATEVGVSHTAERDELIEHNQAVIGSDKWAAAVDAPRELDIWLEPGAVLVGPQTGDRYHFLRWDGGWAVVWHEADGTEMRIAQADVTTWQYLPKASAEGIAAAQRRVPWRRTFVMHERTWELYEVLGMDNIVTGKMVLSHACGTKCSESERAVSPTELQRDYRAVCEHGGAQGQCLKCGSAPTYAVGNRVRWTEDPRPMFVRQVGFTGVSVSPTPDGTYTALARFEDLSPWVEGRPSSGLDKIVADLDAAEAKVSELLIENGTLKEQNGRWAVEASDAIAELGRLRQRLLWMIGHWQTQGRGTTVPVEDIAMALRDSR